MTLQLLLTCMCGKRTEHWWKLFLEIMKFGNSCHRRLSGRHFPQQERWFETKRQTLVTRLYRWELRPNKWQNSARDQLQQPDSQILVPESPTGRGLLRVDESFHLPWYPWCNNMWTVVEARQTLWFYGITGLTSARSAHVYSTEATRLLVTMFLDVRAEVRQTANAAWNNQAGLYWIWKQWK